MQNNENILKTAVESDSDPIVGIMFECRQSLKNDFGACVQADGHETFSAGLRQVMLRYVRRIKARGRNVRQMQCETVSGVGVSDLSGQAGVREALAGDLHEVQTVTEPPRMPQDQ